MKHRNSCTHRKEKQRLDGGPKRLKSDAKRQMNAVVVKVLVNHPQVYNVSHSPAELLIDVTSHELRQPVSAILNCSALVRENLASWRDELRECYKQGSNFVPRQALLSVIEEDLEALDSIYQVRTFILELATF
jgi:hypothetical protein